MTEPAFAHGKICYIQLPSKDPQASAEFFRSVVGWNIRTHDDGTPAFDDTVGQVSGMWETRLQAVDDPGFLISIMVENVAEAARRWAASGGTIVKEPWNTGRENLALVRDPDGNLWSLYHGGELD